MRNIGFLVDPAQRSLASSTLRSEQLCTICQYLFAGESFTFSVCSNFLELRNTLIIMSKSFLVTAKLLDIEAMRDNGNMLVGDWLDYRIRTDLSCHLDALISSSRQQHAYFCETFDGKPIFHLTHHVDLRIPAVDICNASEIQIAYFGNPSNARFKDSFDTSIDMVNAWDSRDLSWMYRLEQYNCHYAVRDLQQWDGFKPFTKGFIAAHCRAAIIVDEDDNEAATYLGADYPFRLRLRDEKDFRRGISFLKDAFNTPIWEFALAKMRAVHEATRPQALKGELERIFQLAR